MIFAILRKAARSGPGLNATERERCDYCELYVATEHLKTFSTAWAKRFARFALIVLPATIKKEWLREAARILFAAKAIAGLGI